MGVHLALLRAVNVGGRSVAMAELREVMAALGLGGARTLLQSGNAVFTSAKAQAAIEGALGKAIAKRFGLETDVFVRTAKEWEAAIEGNPFPAEAKKDPAHLVLMPLASAPTKEQLSSLRAAIKGRERVETDGRHAYLVYPDGIGTSKLTIQVIESKLGTRGAARNWNTPRKLATLAKELA